MKKISIIASVLIITGTLLGGMNILKVEAGHPDALRWEVTEGLNTEKISHVTSVEKTGKNNSSGVITYMEKEGAVKTFEMSPIHNLQYQPYDEVMVYINEKYKGGLGALINIPLKGMKVERRTSYLVFGATSGQIFSDNWYVFVVEEDGNNGNGQNQGNQQVDVQKAEGFIQEINLEESTVTIGKEGSYYVLTVDSGSSILLNGVDSALSDLSVGDKVEKATYEGSTNILLLLEVKRE